MSYFGNSASYTEQFVSVALVCLCGSLAQCTLSLKRLSAGPGFNPQTRQNKLFQDYWRACFEINFSDRQEGLKVSSATVKWLLWLSALD